MTAMSRTSRRYGLLGTLAAHGLILAVCLICASQALPTPLPPGVDSVRISLGEAVDAGSGPGAAGESAIVATAPEPPTPEPPTPEPLTPEPLTPEPLTPEPLTPKPQPEQPPLEETVALQKPAKEKPAEKKPRPKPAPSAPRREAQPGAQTGGADPAGGAGQAGGGSGTGAGTAAGEARATALSILIARIEGAKRYPVAARRLGLEGRVLAEVQLDAQGRITGVRARGGKTTHPLLEKATLEALQRVQSAWKPVPVPGPLTLTVPIRYSLRDS